MREAAFSSILQRWSKAWINDCAAATSEDSQFSSSWSLKGCYRVHTKHNQNVSTITFSDLGRQKKNSLTQNAIGVKQTGTV